jgi:hypothetical protein
MARMNRRQDPLTAIRDDVGVHMGWADAAVCANANVREDVHGPWRSRWALCGARSAAWKPRAG